MLEVVVAVAARRRQIWAQIPVLPPSTMQPQARHFISLSFHFLSYTLNSTKLAGLL